MLEYGHPMHAFDYKYVKGGKIIVRNAQDDETIMTLDGVERKLSPEMLVICCRAGQRSWCYGWRIQRDYGRYGYHCV